MDYNEQILDKYILFFSLYLVKSQAYYFNVIIIFIKKTILYNDYLLLLFVIYFYTYFTYMGITYKCFVF